MTSRGRRLGPDWAGKVRRAVIGLGVVWVGIGAGITAYFAIMGPAGDVQRGLYLIMLGVAAVVVGIAWSRRSKRRPRTQRDR